MIPDKADATAVIRQSLTILTKIREATGNPCLPMQQIHVFLYVALAGVVPMSVLEGAAQVSQASTSRNVTALGGGWPSEPGYGLLEAYTDPGNCRRKLVRLTKKGKALAWDLLQG